MTLGFLQSGKKQYIYYFYFPDSYQEIITQEKQKGGAITRNCPLLATLRMFFSSASSTNKNAGGEQGSDSGSDEDQDEE